MLRILKIVFTFYDSIQIQVELIQNEQILLLDEVNFSTEDSLDATNDLLGRIKHRRKHQSILKHRFQHV